MCPKCRYISHLSVKTEALQIGAVVMVLFCEWVKVTLPELSADMKGEEKLVHCL